jgi:hypothetical protein
MQIKISAAAIGTIIQVTLGESVINVSDILIKNYNRVSVRAPTLGSELPRPPCKKREAPPQ